MSGTKASQRREAAARTVRGVAQAWEDRTALVKKEMAAESAAMDAKTVKLRALRLAKEAEDAEAARNAPPPQPKQRKSKS